MNTFPGIEADLPVASMQSVWANNTARRVRVNTAAPKTVDIPWRG
jgi:hypothetical protein